MANVLSRPSSFIRLADFLATKPSMDEIAQHIALDTCAGINPRVVLINLFDSTGTVRTSGSFGVPASVNGSAAHTTLWDTAPSSEAIRDGNPVVVASVTEFAQRYPELRDHADLFAPAVIWPIQNGQQRVGAIHLQCDTLPDGEIADWEFHELGAILALYLRFNNHHPDVSRAKAELTPRQQEVLRYMGRGATNAQIAKLMGFSESTIKQETMSIYRNLQVNSRAEAVRASQDH